MSPFFDDGDQADVERTYDAPPFEGLTELHVRCYRVLHGCSHPGIGGFPVARINQDTLAAKLGVSVRMVGQLIADMRTPEPDPRKPGSKPAGRCWGWLRVVPRQRKSRKGGAPALVGNDYVLLVSWAEVSSFKAAPNRSAPAREEPIGTSEQNRSAPSREDAIRSAPAQEPVSAGGTDRHEQLRADEVPPTVKRATASKEGKGSPVRGRASKRARAWPLPAWLDPDLTRAFAALHNAGLRPSLGHVRRNVA